jgi:hypothetical protein
LKVLEIVSARLDARQQRKAEKICEIFMAGALKATGIRCRRI